MITHVYIYIYSSIHSHFGSRHSLSLRGQWPLLAEAMEDRLHEIEIQRALAIRGQSLEEEVSQMFHSMFHVSDVPSEVLFYVQEAAKAYQGSNCFKAIQLLKKVVLRCEDLWQSTSEYEYIVLRVELKNLINNIRDSLVIRIQL